ncbi:MAG: WD40 repeat domain-containing protein [Planctomycetaceae bacterium]|nr:WD40 repeat domain-containing protein [Planctomycetaceae bacterium]
MALLGAVALSAGPVWAQLHPTRFDPKVARVVASLAAERAQAVAFSPDESLLVVASHDDEIRSFDTKTWELRRKLHAGHGMPDCLAFSPERNRVLAASAGNDSVKLWNFTPGQVLFDLKGHNSLVFAIAFSPDGKTLASAGQRIEAESATCEVIFWSVATGERVRSIRQPTSGMVKSIAFSPDGRLLACSGSRAPRDELPLGEVLIWEVATGKEFATLEAPPGEVQRVAFSPDGRSVAAATDQMVRGAVTVWDVASGRQKFLADQLPCAALDLAFSPDGRLLAVAVGDMRWRSLIAIIRGRDPEQAKGAEESFRPGDVNFYDAQTGESLGIVPHNVPIHRVTFSPRGKYLATAGYDINADFSRNKTVAVWDLFPLNEAQ